MIELSIQELKQSLSTYLARAEAGETFVVTRHGRAVARITTAATPDVRVGKRFGKTSLREVIVGDLGSRALEILAEDRRDRAGDWFERP